MKLFTIIKILIIILLIISILYIIFHWFITNISAERMSIMEWIYVIYGYITGKREGMCTPGCQKQI